MLVEGDVIEIKGGMRVYADVPEHFAYSNKKGSFELTHAGIIIDANLEYLCGKYIVTKIVNEQPVGRDGGIIGGNHVYCINADNDTIKVDFYQSGGFTIENENIKPIGKAVLTWKIKEEQ